MSRINRGGIVLNFIICFGFFLYSLLMISETEDILIGDYFMFAIGAIAFLVGNFFIYKYLYSFFLILKDELSLVDLYKFSISYISLILFFGISITQICGLIFISKPEVILVMYFFGVFWLYFFIWFFVLAFFVLLYVPIWMFTYRKSRYPS